MRTDCIPKNYLRLHDGATFCKTEAAAVTFDLWPEKKTEEAAARKSGARPGHLRRGISGFSELTDTPPTDSLAATQPDKL